MDVLDPIFIADAEEHVEAGASCDGNNPQAVQPKRYRSGGLGS